MTIGGISILAGGIGARFRKSTSAQIVLYRLAAFVFVGLAVKLAMARR